MTATRITVVGLRRLERAASPAPWQERDAIAGSLVHSVIVAGDRIVAETGRFPDAQAKADARFILASVAYVRSLIANDRRDYFCVRCHCRHRVGSAIGDRHDPVLA